MATPDAEDRAGPITDKQIALARRAADTARQHGDGHWHTVLADHITRLAAEVERARADLAQAGRHGAEAYERAGLNGAELITSRAQLEQVRAELKAVTTERDQLAGQVERVTAVIAPASWEHAMVRARDVRDALTVEEADRS